MKIKTDKIILLEKALTLAEIRINELESLVKKNYNYYSNHLQREHSSPNLKEANLEGKDDWIKDCTKEVPIRCWKI